MASELGARAFTVDKDVFFGAGEFAPTSHRGQHLLAHEVSHILQHPDSQVVHRQVCPRDPVRVPVPEEDVGPGEDPRICTDKEPGNEARMLQPKVDARSDRCFVVRDFPIDVADVGDFPAEDLIVLGGLAGNLGLKLIGFTDCFGLRDASGNPRPVDASLRYNASLRLRRAENLARFLIESVGVMPNQIVGVEGAPLDTFVEPNETPDERAMNRSVAIAVLGRIPEPEPEPEPEPIDCDRALAFEIAETILGERSRNESEQRAFCLVRKLQRAIVDDRYVSAPGGGVGIDRFARGGPFELGGRINRDPLRQPPIFNVEEFFSIGGFPVAEGRKELEFDVCAAVKQEERRTDPSELRRQIRSDDFSQRLRDDVVSRLRQLQGDVKRFRDRLEGRIGRAGSGANLSFREWARWVGERQGDVNHIYNCVKDPPPTF